MPFRAAILIVLIIGDDHGYPYSGFMGHPIVETPTLDHLARGGTVFTTAYTTASGCRPLREGYFRNPKGVGPSSSR